MGSTLAVANKSRVPIPDWSSRLRALERFLIEKFLKVSSGREPKRHMQQCEIENEKDFSSRSPSSAYISSFVESAASGGERWRMRSWKKSELWNLPTQQMQIYVCGTQTAAADNSNKREEWWFVRCSTFVPHFGSPCTSWQRSHSGLRHKKNLKINSIHEL